MFFPKHPVQTIYFDDRSKQITVSSEGYHQIQAMIERYRVCYRCHQPFSSQNPQVSLNYCQVCFLKKHSRLVYLGQVSPEPLQYSGYQHKFLGQDGRSVYVLGSEDELREDLSDYKDARQTLLYWNFPTLPDTYHWKDQQVRLHGCYVQLVGDVRTDPVVLVVYHETNYSSPDITLVFLAERGSAEVREFEKRKGEGRKLWQAAKQRLEATRDGQGYYHLNGSTRCWTGNSDLYFFVVQLLREQRQQS